MTGYVGIGVHPTYPLTKVFLVWFAEVLLFDCMTFRETVLLLAALMFSEKRCFTLYVQVEAKFMPGMFIVSDIARMTCSHLNM